MPKNYQVMAERLQCAMKEDFEDIDRTLQKLTIDSSSLEAYEVLERVVNNLENRKRRLVSLASEIAYDVLARERK